MSKTYGKLFGTPSKEYTSSSTPTGFGSLSPEAQKLYNSALSNAQGLTAANFSPAPLTAQQNQAIGYFSQPTQTITPEQFQSGLSIFTNPFEEQVLQNTIRDINTEAKGGFSDIASFASDIGGYGSDRRGILEAELQKNLLKTIGDISASSRASNFENAAARTLAEIGNVRNLDFSKMGGLFDIGSRIQDQNTAAQNAPVQLNQYLANLAGMLSGGGQVTSGTSIGATEGFLNSKAGSALLSAGLMAMSDRRYKENIIARGKRNGFNIYEFKYKGRLGRFIGVMAQEIEEILPSAVTEINGIKHVDYSKLGFRMEVVHV